MKKNFKLSADEIKSLSTHLGRCFASDRITVDGRPVGFMYREEPADIYDSGWMFLAGDESDAYMTDPANFEIYDVSIIANYDPDIIPLLDALEGSAFVRTDSGLVADIEGPSNESN